MAGADQSMIARFKKAAERQDELLAGGNIFDKEEKKKKAEEEARAKITAMEANRDFLLTRDRQAQESDLAKQLAANAGRSPARMALSQEASRLQEPSQGSSRGKQGGGSMDEYIKAKLAANPMATDEELRKGWDTLNAPAPVAPTADDVITMNYSQMSNDEFRNAVNNPNSAQPKVGWGYVEQVGGKGFTRVLGDTVSSGPIQSRASTPGASFESLKTGTPMERKNLYSDARMSLSSPVIAEQTPVKPISRATPEQQRNTEELVSPVRNAYNSIRDTLFNAEDTWQKKKNPLYKRPFRWE